MQRVDTWEASGYKYNWDGLTDGDVWEAKQGEDFTCTIQSFQTQLRTQATTRHLKVHIEIRGKAVRFQFYKVD